MPTQPLNVGLNFWVGKLVLGLGDHQFRVVMQPTLDQTGDPITIISAIQQEAFRCSDARVVPNGFKLTLAHREETN